MSLITILILFVITFTADTTNGKEIRNKNFSKRGLPLYAEDLPIFTSSLAAAAKLNPYPLGPWAAPRSFPPTPSEVANAIAAAKQASANVLIAQQQVQAAKEHVLNQQKIAMEKETNAAILTQKSETAAAIQRSESASAAQAVVLAQQRLAAAKAAVAHEQKIASAKESHAAAALQSSAHAAAAEIQRTEHEASKLATLQRTGAASIAHHVSATKDAALAPLTTGSNHIPNSALSWSPISTYVSPHGPWAPTAGAAAGSYYLPPKAAFTINPIWG